MGIELLYPLLIIILYNAIYLREYWEGRGFKKAILLLSVFFTQFLPIIFKIFFENTIEPIILPGMSIGIIGILIILHSKKIMGEHFKMAYLDNKPKELVTKGTFKYIRHPIYLGNILAVISLSILTPNIVSISFLFINSSIMFHFIIKEEILLEKTFNRSFFEYKKKTWKLIPFIF